MKKLIAVILTFVFSLSAAAAALAENDISVFVDGGQLTFDAQPFIENDRALVPMRAIFEALGADVEWNGEARTVTAVKDNMTVTLIIDYDVMSIYYDLSEEDSSEDNQTAGYIKSVPLDAPATIADDRTFVPLRAVSEAFDCGVEWDGASKTVTITSVSADNRGGPEATPAPSETAAPSEETDYISARTLTESDMETLQGQAETLRYAYEQLYLPSYAFEYAGEMYEILGDETAFSGDAVDLWNTVIASSVIKIQRNSDTEYVFDITSSEESNNDRIFIDFYSDIIKRSGLGADNYLEDAICTETANGTRIGTVIFRTADNLVDCKYIGIAASKNGNVRYFTAENDATQTDDWFFCEVTDDSRETVSTFKKKNNTTDLETFTQIITSYYEG